MVKSLLISIVIMTSLMLKAQSNLDQYKYVIVPKKFDEFKKENQYRTSTLIKLLFSKKGFKTVYEHELPEELNNNRCLGLRVHLIDNSSMFTTKAALSLKDCNSKEVAISSIGKSKSKEFQQAYTEAITKAFNSFSGLEYTYKPDASENNVIVSFKNDVKSVQEKSSQSRNGMHRDSMVIQVATLENQSFKDKRPIASGYSGEVQIATKEEQSAKSANTLSANDKKEGSNSRVADMRKSLNSVLYANKTTNGYHLVDSTPRIKIRIYKSAMPNVYVAKADDNEGIVYTADGKWFFEYYSNNEMVIEELNVKF